MDGLEDRWQTLPDSTKKVLDDKFFRLHAHLEEIERIEKQRILEGNTPWQEAGEGNAEFYREKIRPQFEKLRSLWLIDFSIDFGNIEPSSDLSAGNDVASFIQAAIQRCEGLWEQFPEDDSVFSEYAFEEARNLVASNLFRPDQWLKNLEDLRPIVSGKEASKIPLHVRVRLTEICHSFFFGNWLAVKALSRSLLEYEILDRSGTLGIAAREDNGNTKDIGKITDLITTISSLKNLKEAMDRVVSHGHDVMHPKKKKNVEIIITKRVREEALDCIQGCRTFRAQSHVFNIRPWIVRENFRLSSAIRRRASFGCLIKAIRRKSARHARKVRQPYAP